MALTDYKIPIVEGRNSCPSIEGEPNHPNAAYICANYNSLVDDLDAGQLAPDVESTKLALSQRIVWIYITSAADVGSPTTLPPYTTSNKIYPYKPAGLTITGWSLGDELQTIVGVGVTQLVTGLGEITIAVDSSLSLVTDVSAFRGSFNLLVNYTYGSITGTTTLTVVVVDSRPKVVSEITGS